LHSHLRPAILFALGLAAGCFVRTSAQSLPTATRQITPSVFVGASGVRTGLSSGRNLSITAGLDLTFLPRSRFQPAFEYRGTYAVDKGGIDSIKNNLVGMRVSKSLGRFHPYGDILFGRGETTYANGGYQVPNTPIFYTQSASNVYSGGGGTELFATRQLALKVDVQIQHYSSPVTTSGSLFSESATVGLAYVFHLGRSRQRTITP
jgi:hypothetical protein